MRQQLEAKTGIFEGLSTSCHAPRLLAGVSMRYAGNQHLFADLGRNGTFLVRTCKELSFRLTRTERTRIICDPEPRPDCLVYASAPDNISPKRTKSFEIVSLGQQRSGSV